MADTGYDGAQRAAVVKAYQDGEKIAAMEKRLDIPRASIYDILKASGVAPARLRRPADTGDPKHLAHLRELLETQNRYIQDLEAENEELRRRLSEIP